MKSGGGGEGEIERKKTIERRGSSVRSPYPSLSPSNPPPIAFFLASRPFHLHSPPSAVRLPPSSSFFLLEIRPRRTHSLAPSVIFHAAISTLPSIGRSVSAFSLPFISDWNEIERDPDTVLLISRPPRDILLLLLLDFVSRMNDSVWFLERRKGSKSFVKLARARFVLWSNSNRILHFFLLFLRKGIWIFQLSEEGIEICVSRFIYYSWYNVFFVVLF